MTAQSAPQPALLGGFRALGGVGRGQRGSSEQPALWFPVPSFVLDKNHPPSFLAYFRWAWHEYFIRKSFFLH